MISIERIVGALFSGFACRIYAGASALWIASEAWHAINAPMHAIANVLH